MREKLRKKLGNYFGAEYFSPRTLYSFKKTITCQVLVEVINIIYTDAKLDTGLKSTVQHRLALPPHSLECCSCEEGARCRTIKVIYSTLTLSPPIYIIRCSSEFTSFFFWPIILAGIRDSILSFYYHYFLVNSRHRWHSYLCLIK